MKEVATNFYFSSVQKGWRNRTTEREKKIELQVVLECDSNKRSALHSPFCCPAPCHSWSSGALELFCMTVYLSCPPQALTSLCACSVSTNAFTSYFTEEVPRLAWSLSFPFLISFCNNWREKSLLHRAVSLFPPPPGHFPFLLSSHLMHMVGDTCKIQRNWRGKTPSVSGDSVATFSWGASLSSQKLCRAHVPLIPIFNFVVSTFTDELKGRGPFQQMVTQ